MNHCTVGIKGSVVQTGGKMSVMGDCVTSGAVEITQSGDAKSEMYFADNMNQGDTLTINQSNTYRYHDVTIVLGNDTLCVLIP